MNGFIIRGNDVRKGSLIKSEWTKLEELGFQWDRQDGAWSDMFDELQKYKNEHDNTDVPNRHEQNSLKLGEWVQKQRQRI